jgi:hypothetical protein
MLWLASNLGRPFFRVETTRQSIKIYSILFYLKVDPTNIIQDDTIAPADAIPVPAIVPQIVPPAGPNIVPNDNPDAPSPTPPMPTPTPPTPAPVIVESVSPPAVTFENSTGPKGRHHRKANHGKPNKSKSHHHKYGTRANNPSPASAAHLEAVPAHWALHGNVLNPDTGKIAQYKELSQCSEGALWQRGNSLEIGPIAQGLGDIDPSVKGTNTMFFMDRNKVPKGRKVTYLNIISTYRPEKKDPHCVPWTCGGDQVKYPGNVGTKTADITTAKILINSVLSTPDAKMLPSDLKDFYLGTPMERYEYMRIPIHMIPDDIMDLYDLRGLVH